MKLLPSLSILGFALVTIGCDDPSPLTVDLVDTSSGAPELVEASAGRLSASVAPDITGNARRSLVGTVSDPVAGTVTASAGLDFASPVALSQAFRDGPVTEAELRLVRTYRYGDTTATLPVAVRSVDVAWTASGANSKASIPFGNTITTGDAMPGDTLVRIPLPSSWIDANSALLRSNDFLNDFHGLYFEATGGNAVLGFSSSGSLLRVVSGADTIDFVVSRNLTLIDRDNSGTVPAGVTLLQDGVGQGIEIEFDAATELVGSSALNRVVLRVPIDTTTAPPPPNFVRPRPLLVDLAGVTEDSITVTLSVGTEENGVLLFDSATLTSVVQDIVLDRSPFPKYVLKGHLDVAPVDNTIDVLVIPNGSTGNESPKLTFTIVKP